MKSRILVVDDNEDHRFLTSRAITSARKDVRVDLAEDGESALRRAEASLPDLVLLDVKMPGMDGFEVLRRFREGAATRRLRIVLFSSSESDADRRRGESLGATAYVTKPLDATLFVQTVRETVARFLGSP